MLLHPVELSFLYTELSVTQHRPSDPGQKSLGDVFCLDFTELGLACGLNRSYVGTRTYTHPHVAVRTRLFAYAHANALVRLDKIKTRVVSYGENK